MPGSFLYFVIQAPNKDKSVFLTSVLSLYQTRNCKDLKEYKKVYILYPRGQHQLKSFLHLFICQELP